MPSRIAERKRALGAAGRELSTSTVLFHQMVAQQLKLNASDHKCLDLLLREGPMTAGELATRSGFTTGAVTGIVNRLKARGFARREPDGSDRRRVVACPEPATVHTEMWPLLQPMIERMDALHDSYRASELELLLNYVRRCEAVLRKSAAELAAAQGGRKVPGA